MVPRINAATGLDLWRETFDAPGVLYAAYPLHRRRGSPVPGPSRPTGCADEEIVAYDDGAFVGEWWRHTGCGADGQAERHVIVASPASADFTVVVDRPARRPQDRPVLESCCARSTSRRRRRGRPPTTTALATHDGVHDDDHDRPPGGPTSSTPVETPSRSRTTAGCSASASRPTGTTSDTDRSRQRRRVVQADDRRRAEHRRLPRRVRQPGVRVVRAAAGRRSRDRAHQRREGRDCQPAGPNRSTTALTG